MVWFLHAVHVGGEIFDLCPEDEVPPLRVRQEHDEEHDRETSDVFRAWCQRVLKLVHGLVERDVLEHLEEKKGKV